MILPACFDHLEERFFYKEVQLQNSLFDYAVRYTLLQNSSEYA